MRHPTRMLIGTAVTTVLVATTTVALSTGASATGETTLETDEALGLGDDGTSLRIFKLKDPDSDNFIAQVSGLQGADTKLVGIDYRKTAPNIGAFYGVGNGGGIYTINTLNGQATNVDELEVALSGTHFDIDFNPAADRLRIISDNGQNLRHQISGSTTNDGVLDYAGVTAPGVTGAAYTNNDLSADTGTALFDLDANLDQVAIQLPPNDGTLTQTGKTGLAVSPIVGFDIQSKLSSGRTVSNVAYASLRSSDGGEPNLYKVDVLSGKVTKVGDFDRQVADIAVKQP